MPVDPQIQSLLDKGAIVWSGTVEEFTAQPELQARYLQV